MASHYVHGKMDISAQKSTFHGFMGWVVYGGSAVAMVLLYPILVFCAHVPWHYSLLATVIVSLIIGRALKLNAAWYALVVIFGVITGIAWSLFAAFI